MKYPFEEFGSRLFDEKAMKERLPRPTFLRWKESTTKEAPMDREVANDIAHSMKVWALEQGATHYSHWFFPMTGSSAEKHDAFLTPDENGEPITRFSGSALIKGETDGSSFPNGGLRATFEARGYTYWDVSSPAFVRGHVLFIPTIFVSYNGETLDTKAPLLKAMDSLNTQATRVVNALGEKSIKSVKPMVGLEQEYFLIDREKYLQRNDLVFTGRTLFGHEAPKEQELESHYFGAIPSKILHFMEDVNAELWKIGVYCSVEHNEVAPSQFEISSVYANANVAIDQNMLTMETLERVAIKHGLTCLTHEKPFAGINGSGKHNNWSLVTDDGQNLFDPGDKPHENVRFLVFICAVIEAVAKYPVLLRMAASGPGNDHRLGANEAPPAIISVFTGGVVEDLFSQLEKSKDLKLSRSAGNFSPLSSLSELPKDNSDRNRTSPFTFTGNKFEFRMLGSSENPAFTNTALCAIMAESLEKIADRLEKNKYIQDAREDALQLCQDIIKANRNIIFNGDGYASDWIVEAEKRGLPNVKSYIESVSSLVDHEVTNLFGHFGILSEAELKARYEIKHENFIKTINTEALTLSSIVRRQLIPALMKEIRQVVRTVDSVEGNSKYLGKHRVELVSLLDELDEKVTALDTAKEHAESFTDMREHALYLQHTLRPLLDDVRVSCDHLEAIVPETVYPVPTYIDLLFK